MTRASRILYLGALTGASLAVVPSAPLLAQTRVVSREVVQPLPAETSGDLTEALNRLARDPKNVTAMIDAGVASLELGDTDAALGFFGRAQELSPQNPRIKAGFAAAYARQQRPVEALRLFDEAEKEGVSITRLAGERGLAYDLVGAGAQAQSSYKTALEQSDDPEVRRRLALSYAIGGNRDAFEATLRPLLDLRDPAAIRARAFGLAILGDSDGAVAIADAAMPREIARKLAPYLQYMPRLTAAQQAAAANLGVFPRATQIGHDDPRIASAADSFGLAEARLRPTGAPLGPAVQPEKPVEQRPKKLRNKEKTGSTATITITEAVPPEAGTRPLQTPEPAREGSAGIAEADAAVPAQTGIRVTEVARTSGELPPVTVQPPSAPTEAPATALVVVPREESAPTNAGATVVASIDPSANTAFDLSKAAPEPEGLREVAPTASVAEAFADLTMPEDAILDRPGNAVDITRIAIPREAKPEPEPEKPAKVEPAKPVDPSRIWVQIATGKDRDALGWDWRRFSRKADKLLDGKGPFTTPWGEANRLLAGPYESRKAAQDALDKLKEAGIDGFLFTSRAGEAIDPLK